MKTGIFGGSFNPIHNGHIRLARQMLALSRLDEIWFVVSPQNPLKRQADLLDDRQRLDMVRLALTEEPQMTACDYEFRLPRPSYTWNTLQSMSRDYPDREFTLLIGGDNWADFDRWYHHDDILGNYPIVIYPRGGSQVDAEALPAGVTLANTGLIGISSTEVRRRIRMGLSFDSLVPPVVANKIIAEHLYF